MYSHACKHVYQLHTNVCEHDHTQLYQCESLLGTMPLEASICAGVGLSKIGPVCVRVRECTRTCTFTTCSWRAHRERERARARERREERSERETYRCLARWVDLEPVRLAHGRETSRVKSEDLGSLHSAVPDLASLNSAVWFGFLSLHPAVFAQLVAVQVHASLRLALLISVEVLGSLMPRPRSSTVSARVNGRG